ncbi:MAG: VOC family protein [Caulobacter sp.]|nr:VOC family protein [Caulobacter sp.]
MPAVFRHFAINANDVQRAKSFYQDVFGWSFSPWGPPDFYQIRNAGSGLLGALQERRDLRPGVSSTSFETTFGVDDLKTTMTAIEAAGGKIVMQPYRIEGVGELIYFEDSEGNLVGAMQYDRGVFD